MIDEKRFFEAYLRVTGSEKERVGIGRLSEKSLHSILKCYLEPREELHEVTYLGCVLDVKNEEGIIEVQTGSFTPIIPKIKKLLPHSKLTLVHPIIAEKTLIWIDKETGELTEPKKSPKKGKFSDALPELSKLSGLLFSEGFTVKLMLLSADEYKYLDGYGKDRKKRATKVEKIPKRLIGEFDIKTKSDLNSILPPLPATFTSADFNKATGLRRRKAFYSLKLLLREGVIEQCGKVRNAFLYRLSDNKEPKCSSEDKNI